jgi:hypothetical protein
MTSSALLCAKWFSAWTKASVVRPFAGSESYGSVL